jgi:hypothetical protein
MSEHAQLAAMVGFVGNHVAQHFRANRPGLGPAVSVKLLDVASTAERFCEHLPTAGGALCQYRAGLPWRAIRAVALSRDLQVRSRKPDPLRADIVHVREDCRDGASLAGRLRSPRSRVKMLDHHLVDALIDGKIFTAARPSGVQALCWRLVTAPCSLAQ